jgi:ribosomal protein S12 methylthiotransferase accessory factor
LLGQFDEALSVFERSELSISRVLSELLHVKIQELAFVEFQEGLEAVFGAEKVDKARSIIEGLAYMIDVTLHVHYANILVLYDKLHVKKATMIV